MHSLTRKATTSKTLPGENLAGASPRYPDIKEDLPSNAPKPHGKSIKLNIFCDASHATNQVTRRSTTGIIIFLNGTPVKWYSKRQNTIESSTFGFEFVALKIAAEMNDAMR